MAVAGCGRRVGRGRRTVRPEGRPPGDLLGVGVAPRRRRGPHVGEARRQGPGAEHASGVRFAAVGAGHPAVQALPCVQTGGGRVPGHRRVVRVAGGHDPARPAHPAHLAQRPYRIPDVLEHLVGVDHVEGAVGEVQGVDVGHGEGDPVRQPPLPGVRAGLVQDVRGGVHRRDRAFRADQLGQVGGDRAGAAADVQDGHARPQLAGQVRGRVRRGAPAVRAQDRLVVAVGVDGRFLRFLGFPRLVHALTVDDRTGG